MPNLISQPTRVVLLGGNGLLGQAFHRALAQDTACQFLPLSRAQLNLTNPAHFEAALENVEFDWLVNCAAYTRVDDCEIQGELAFLVNGQAPGRLAELCARRGARMLHFSTDYVFDGEKDAPYDEHDLANPLSVYGRSKLMGEELVLRASAEHVVVRLSWLFGAGRPAFPEWVISQASNKEILEVASDKFAAPTYNHDAAFAFLPWLYEKRLPGGIFHFCNPPTCAWVEYAQAVLDISSEKGLPLLTRTARPISIGSLAGMVARRPKFSTLSVEKFTRITGVAPRTWKDALREHLINGVSGQWQDRLI